MRKTQLGFTLSELLLCLLCIGILGAGLYVAFHFISKFW